MRDLHSREVYRDHTHLLELGVLRFRPDSVTASLFPSLLFPFSQQPQPLFFSHCNAVDMASSSSPSSSSLVKMLQYAAGAAIFLTPLQFQGAAAHPLAEPQLPQDSMYLASGPSADKGNQIPTLNCTTTPTLTITKTVYPAPYRLTPSSPSSSLLTTTNVNSSCSSGLPPLRYSTAPSSTPTTPTTISTPSVLSIGATATPILQSIAPPLEPQPSGYIHTSLESYPQVTTGVPWPRIRKLPLRHSATSLTRIASVY